MLQLRSSCCRLAAGWPAPTLAPKKEKGDEGELCALLGRSGSRHGRSHSSTRRRRCCTKHPYPRGVEGQANQDLTCQIAADDGVVVVLVATYIMYSCPLPQRAGAPPWLHDRPPCRNSLTGGRGFGRKGNSLRVCSRAWEKIVLFLRVYVLLHVVVDYYGSRLQSRVCVHNEGREVCRISETCLVQIQVYPITPYQVAASGKQFVCP